MEAFVQVLRNIGAVRLALMGTLLAGLISGVTYLSNRMMAPDMMLLYGDLELEDAGKIASRLESQGVPVEVRGGGTQIYAPSDRVTRLRVELAEAGLPRGGSVGYEIFDKGDQLGVSSFVQNINQLRALEGELARTITSIAQISAARVHLVLPKRKLFSREKDEPTASIMLTMAGPGTLSSRRVQAIRQLVAAAVPGLAPEHVSIVDDRGNLLAKGDDDTESALSANLEEKRLAYENRLSRTIESLVSKYVGDGKVRAEVAADMSFDKITENSESFDPEGQVARSTQTVSLGEKSHETDASVSAAKNLPNASSGGAGSENQVNRSEETVNYEVSKKIRTLVKEVGEVKKLSVAVLVDGVYTPVPGKKEMDYKPRSKEEIDSLTKLIKNAVGFDEKRGDSIEVANMRFAPMEMFESEAPAGTIMGLEKHDLIHLAEVLLVGILGLIGILFGIKPMVNRVMSGMPAPLPAANQEAAPLGLPGEAPAALGAPQGNPALPAPGQRLTEGASPSSDLEHLSDGLKELEHMVNIKQVEGAVRASSLKAVGDIITENPESAVGVIRGWLGEEEKKGRA